MKLNKFDLSAPAVSKDSKKLMKLMDEVVGKSDYVCSEKKRCFIGYDYSDSEKCPRTTEQRFHDTYEELVGPLQVHLEFKTAQKKLTDHFPHLKKGHETLEKEITDLQHDLAMKPEELQEKYAIERQLLLNKTQGQISGHHEDMMEFYRLTQKCTHQAIPMEMAQEICLKLNKFDLSAPAVSKDSKMLMELMDEVVGKSDYVCSEKKRCFIGYDYSDSEKCPRTTEQRFHDTYEELVGPLQVHLEFKTAQKKLTDHFPHLKKGHETLEKEITDLQHDLAMKPEELQEKYAIERQLLLNKTQSQI